jgi:hypothetical protein
LSFNKTILGETVAFNATIDINANVPNQTVEARISINNVVVLDRIYALSDVVIPICVPVVNPIQYLINLCADITGIKINKEKDCFKAALGVELILFKFKHVTLIPPVAFGHNVDKCQ